MYVEYNELPKSSRVWVYQSNRHLTIEEIELISVKAINFIDKWQRHGEDLKASFMLKYKHFLILAVDESFNNVSGCSIDSSVHFIKGLEQELNVDFTDKLNVAVKENNSIEIYKLTDFEDVIKSKELNAETIVFNNMVDTKQDLETKWEVAVKDSWHNRYLN